MWTQISCPAVLRERPASREQIYRRVCAVERRPAQPHVSNEPTAGETKVKRKEP